MVIASVVAILDTSASMTGYVAITVIDSKAFVRSARPGDQIAVVRYDTAAGVAYPPGPNPTLQTVDSGLQVTAAAASAIQGLTFTGGSTNIGGGIIAGKNLLSSPAGRPGMVLLTDGYQNSGTNPLDPGVLPTNIPIFACAMGPNSDQNLLQTIATRTNGQYYYAPYPVDMMRIFNQIRALEPTVQSVANELDNISPQDYQLVPAPIAGSESEGQFAVVWGDPSIAYTPGPPSPTQLSITLVDPNGQTSSIAPTVVGQGYVIFNLMSPTPGPWQVQIMYGAAAQPQPVTTGAFEFGSSVQLALEAPSGVAAGAPATLRAHVADRGSLLENVRMSGEVVAPTISIQNALVKHRDELARVEAPPQLLARGVPVDRAKLEALRHQRLPTGDILAHRRVPLLFRRNADGIHEATFNGTLELGSYNVHVIADGHQDATGSPLRRTQMATLVV